MADQHNTTDRNNTSNNEQVNQSRTQSRNNTANGTSQTNNNGAADRPGTTDPEGRRADTQTNQHPRQATPRQASRQASRQGTPMQPSKQDSSDQQGSELQNVTGQSRTQSCVTLASNPEGGSRTALAKRWGETVSRNSQSVVVRMSINEPTPEKRRTRTTRNPRMMMGHEFISRRPLHPSRTISSNEDGFESRHRTFNSSTCTQMEPPRTCTMHGGYPNGVIKLDSRYS